jgi:hypothetical protein
MPQELNYENEPAVPGHVASTAGLGAWQPIETAPRDGTAVLVAPGIWNDKSCSIAKFNDDRYSRKPRPYWERDDDLGKVTYSRDSPPTHWMPLPAPVSA